MLDTTIDPPLVLDEPSRALLGSIATDAYPPRGVAVLAPGGYGKSALLLELARAYRQAGMTIIAGWPEVAETVDRETVLLIDDAHRIDPEHLRELRRLIETRQARLVLAHRPWPRPAALVELTELLKRDGQSLLLHPFSREQTADYLAVAGGGLSGHPELVDFVHMQTGGVPRDVERLVRALRDRVDSVTSGSPSLTVPPGVTAYFGPDLAELDSDVGRLLLAAAAGLPLSVDLLGALLDRGPEAVDDLLFAARASGLLGADDRLSPLVHRAVVTLSPATHRNVVWQQLTELQLARSAPVLPLVRTLRAVGVAGGCPATTYEAAAEEALAEEPALAAELFAASAAGGRPTAARQALAAALSGDLDTALRLADQLLTASATTTEPVRPVEQADPAAVAAVALAHRGQLSRSAELYRWSGSSSSSAFAAICSIGAGQADALDGLRRPPVADGPPSLLASTAVLMIEGVRESLTGTPTAALSALVQASALLEPTGRAVLLPDSPAALAALIALQCGELDIGEQALRRATAAQLGGPLMSRRHRLLQAWILMVRGDTTSAAQGLATVTRDGTALESRDQLFATALELGIARRNSDLPGLQRGWGHALEALVRHPVDVFMLLPLGEFAIAAARLGEWSRLSPYLREANQLLNRLGDPALWAIPLRWSALHAAILAEEPAVADEHMVSLASTADHSRYAAVIAAAAQSWVTVLGGAVDPIRVEAAARGLFHAGLCWDAARLAGQAAIRTSNRRAMTQLLDCARSFQVRPTEVPAGPATDRAGGPPVTPNGVAPGEGQLSEREQEVARLVLAGLTYKQIGDRLFISAKTVEHHVARMRSRLNCANRGELLLRLRVILTERAATAT